MITNYSEFTASLSRKNRSCGPCAIVKRSCDHERPCGRCVSLGIQDKCIIFVDKRRSKHDVVEEDKLIVSKSYLSNLALSKDNTTKHNHPPEQRSTTGIELLSVSSSGVSPIVEDNTLPSSKISSFLSTNKRRRSMNNDTLNLLPPQIGPFGFNMEYDSLLVSPSLQYPHILSLSPTYVLNRAETIAKTTLSIFNMVPSVPYPSLFDYTKQTPLYASSIIDHSARKRNTNGFLNTPLADTDSITDTSSSFLITSLRSQPTLPSVDPITESLVEQKALQSIAYLTVPCFRIVYEDPDRSMLQNGASLIMKYIALNAKYAEFVGIPTIAKGRLLYVNGNQQLPTHARLDQRLDYGRTIIRAIVARLPVVRQRYSMCAAEGFITIDEIVEIQYGPTGAVHAITMTIYNPDYSTMQPFTQLDLLTMEETNNLRMIEDSPENVTNQFVKSSSITTTVSVPTATSVNCGDEYDCHVPWSEYDPSIISSESKIPSLIPCTTTAINKKEDITLLSGLSSLPTMMNPDYHSTSTLSLSPNHSTTDTSDNELFHLVSLSSSPISGSITELSAKTCDCTCIPSRTLDDTDASSGLQLSEKEKTFFDPFETDSL